MKKQFAIKEEGIHKFLIFELDNEGNKILVNDTCQFLYEVEKFIELNNGVIIEKDMIKEIKNSSDTRGLLFD